jgi:hypothetical protein
MDDPYEECMFFDAIRLVSDRLNGHDTSRVADAFTEHDLAAA